MDKKLRIQPFTIVGTTTKKDAFSCIFSYQPKDEDSLSTHGEIYVVFSATIPGVEADWGRISLESFDQLKERYYGQMSGGIQYNLEEALNETRETFDKTVAQLTVGTVQPTTELHLGALVMWGGSFLYHAAGKVYCALVRNGELIDMTGDKFVQEATQAGDSFVLGTAVFGQRIDAAIVQHIHESKASSDWQKALRDEVKDVEEGALLSGIVLSIEDEEIPDKEDVIELKMSRDGNKISTGGNRMHFSINSIRPFLTTFSERLKLGINRVMSAIRRSGPKEEVFIKTETPSKLSKKWIVVLGLIGLLAVSIYITYRLNKQKEDTAMKEEATSELLGALQQVEELQKIDQVQAKKALDIIQGRLGEVQGVSDTLQGKFQSTYNSLYSVVSPAWSGFSATLSANTRLAANDTGDVLAVDSDTGKIWILRKDGAAQELGSSSEFVGVMFVASGPDGIYGYHPDTGVWFYSFPTAKVEQIMTQSGRWGMVRSMERYQDNLYIFAPEVEDLVKYLGLGGGNLSGGSSYFIDPLDYPSVIDIAIDGHIYTLSQNNQIEKFLGGRRTEFSLHGVYPTGSSFRGITTGVDYSQLYINAGNAVFIFDTEGEYVRMLESNNYFIKDITVVSDESFLVTVTDSGVFWTSL